MTGNENQISKRASELGTTHAQFIDAALLKPAEEIRTFCKDNICGAYGKNLMCPPAIGTLKDAARRLGHFKRGVLLQYSKKADPKDEKDVKRTKRKFHSIVLKMERFLKDEIGYREVWGIIGGSCALCEPCAGFNGRPCVFPEKARTSLEALGIDVLALLAGLEKDNRFHRDRITWTGLVLFRQ